jgi:hypothetical protein
MWRLCVYATKYSLATSRVNMEFVADVSETVSVPITVTFTALHSGPRGERLQIVYKSLYILYIDLCVLLWQLRPKEYFVL